MSTVLNPPLRSFGRRLLREPRRPAAVRESPRAPWFVVGTVCIGAFMGQLDASIVTLALPDIGRDLHASVGAVEWVALSYLLVIVASVATVGRLADAVGRKLLYVYGFAVFTIGSAACGLAPTLAVLIAARVLQGAGAALLQANSIALITEAMPARSLGRAIGAQGSAQALGLALGPAVGGLLLSLGGWQLVFLVNLPVGPIGLLLGWFLLPRSRTRRRIGAADRLGAGLLALAAGGLLLYLSLGSRDGYGTLPLLATLAAGLLAAVGFVMRQRAATAPLIDLSLLRRPGLATGLSGALISYLALFGTLFVVPYFLAADRASVASAGLELAVLPVAIGLAAPIAGRLADRYGSSPLTVGGLVLAATGLLELAVRHDTPGLLLGLAAAGLGFGAFIPANNATVMSASPAGHAGVTGGILNMTRGIGTALGIALAGAVFAAATGVTGPATGDTSAAAAGHGLTAVLAVLGLGTLASAWAAARGREPGAQVAQGAVAGGSSDSRSRSWRRTPPHTCSQSSKTVGSLIE